MLYGTDLLRAFPGLLSWLAPRLGVSQPNLSQWTQVPAERARDIEQVTGIPRHLLRPDLWPPPWQEDDLWAPPDLKELQKLQARKRRRKTSADALVA